MKHISASDAKNNFGGLLEDVATLGRVNIVKHGRVVAVVLSPRAFEASAVAGPGETRNEHWGEKHMIPADRARAARMLKPPSTFDAE